MRHPRLVGPVRRLLGGDVYLHQYPVNPKAAYHGEAWAWHQDYATWQMENHMPRPQVINVGVFLDEVTEFNGPVMFILGSHTHGILTSTFDEASASYALHALSEETVASLAQSGRLVCPKGPAGSVWMFHCNLVHASNKNLSPDRRAICTICYNRGVPGRLAAASLHAGWRGGQGDGPERCRHRYRRGSPAHSRIPSG